MKRSIVARLVLSATILLSAICGMSQFNTTPTLKIGHPAPPVKVQAWLRGNLSHAASSIEKAIEMAGKQKTSAEAIKKMKELLVKYRSATVSN